MKYIDMLESKIETLIDKYSSLKTELKIVQKENSELKSALEVFNKDDVKYEKPQDGSDSPNSPPADSVLDDYIKQIDQCIDLVNDL